MPMLLPTNLACVANFADKKEAGARWAVTGVHVEAKDDGYAVAATDCKALILVEGKYPENQDPSEYPEYGLLKDARNGGVKGLIPAKLFADTFKEAAKNTKRSTKPILRNVAVVMADAVPEVCETRKVTDGEGNTLVIEGGNTKVVSPAIPAEVVMGWTNLESEATPKTRQSEGRFPPYRDIIPKRGLYNVALDIDILINAGKALEGLKGLCGEGSKRVEVSFTSDQKPLLMRMKNEELQQTTTILLMPLHTEKYETGFDGFSWGQGVADETFWQKEAKEQKDNYEALLERFNDNEQEIRSLVSQLKSAKVENWKDHLDSANQRIEALLREIEGMKDQYRECYEQGQKLEEKLYQQSIELTSCHADKEMYRQRAETVATQGQS